ncbi:Scr1 family TA system antitoxin-like transcriptional regulator [Streptomyces sp. NPDC006285]|uniref:helix-turn-helix domain-containing protein n=1 Tax=Streptomyces sp. NPDC006285 TaxID=3364742 RepID=UPI0036ADD873
MGVSGEGVDEAGWDVEPGDEIAPVVESVGRLIKFFREAAGMRAADLGGVMGYGEDLIRKVERGDRIPRGDFLDKADDVLRAGGALLAMKPQLERARYPKKVRELARLEERAVEVSLYSNHNIHGLLQTEEYTRALLGVRRPAYSMDELDGMVAARMERHAIYERTPVPELSFVQEQVTLERPIGGTMVLRRQLEHLLSVAELPSVEVQVMPTRHHGHPGMSGLIELLKFEDGSAIGRSDGAFNGRPISDLRRLRILELRYGIIRAQALSPGETRAFIEQALGEL